ncbi:MULTISPECIES: hypothetical protein [Acinetobacter calcoaceticus/baumannii complex]|uniref:hypothetical protein n=1 Tax=Acinetobacter calcoaceticus/baumannii complex TaxID=909768 RepID=UPI00044A34FF|nr:MULTISPECIES: hypothetical protein [Acinetobacter calcoaceticus/baumannii complex]AJB48460.1 hypothetical protein RR32_10165 [Acinetobacter nosocomialis]EXE78106.1 hypothetical protein J582_1388 [Acinetobacter sp. 1566109]MBJ9961709.1 hypothetical protein [Acinetobacter nosocomialis]MBR7738699.1 hypothetical protein [Acinetobacter nosocomialis]MBR7748767.1 hypothetical protein [Acinetobacter nosocomialis]
MNLKLTLAALLIVPVMLTACAKKEESSKAGQDAASTGVSDKVTPEQQATIDSLDKPVLDEKNTDVVEGSASSKSAASETH